MLIQAVVIYDGTTHTFVGDQQVIATINCDRVQAYSPRPVWLKREQAPGDPTKIIYTPTFAPSSVEVLDSNILQGFWVEVDGKDLMVDAVSANAFQTACDACCGAVPALVTQLYSSGVPAFTPLTLNSFCIARLDDGTVNAHNQIALDYLTRIIGNPKLVSNLTGTSHYSVQSYYTTITPIGNDIIANGACSN